MGQSVVGGEPVSSATTHSSAGQQADEETGLHYNRHRYYDPLQGRYITQNPIGLAGGWNGYGYPLNPVQGMDPPGLFALPLPLPGPGVGNSAQKELNDNAAKALTRWWSNTFNRSEKNAYLLRRKI